MTREKTGLAKAMKTLNAAVDRRVQALRSTVSIQVPNTLAVDEKCKTLCSVLLPPATVHWRLNAMEQILEADGTKS